MRALFVLIVLASPTAALAQSEVTEEHLKIFPVEATLMAATDKMRTAEDHNEPREWALAARLFQVALPRPDASADEKVQAAYGMTACRLQAGLPIDLPAFLIQVPADKAKFRTDLAARLLRKERPHDCAAVLEGVDAAGHSQVLFLQASACSSIKNDERALALFTTFLSRFPTDPMIPKAEFGAARAAHQIGDFAAAEHWFRRVQGKDIPGIDRHDQMLGLAEALFRQGKLNEALPLFEQLRTTNFEQAQFCTLRAAQCLAETGDYRKAVSLVRGVTNPQLQNQAQLFLLRWQILDGQDLDPNARLVAGAESLVLINDFQKAERLLRDGKIREAHAAYQAIDAAPGASRVLHESALCRVVYCDYELEEWQSCRDHADRFLSTYPRSAHAGRLLLLKTFSQSHLKQPAEAEGTLARALEAEPQPDRRRSWLLQAAARFEADGALAQAATALETIVFDYDSRIERPPADVLHVIKCAVAVRDRQPDREAAVKVLRHAMGLAPGKLDGDARNALRPRPGGPPPSVETVRRGDDALSLARLRPATASRRAPAISGIAARNR